MSSHLSALREPLSGILILALAVAVLASGWISTGPIWPASHSMQLLLICLIASVPLAYRFPIYIRHHTKLCLVSVPLYLLTVLLHPVLAGASVMLGMGLGERSVQHQRGTRPSDIAGQVGRWGLLALGGSLVAHLPIPWHEPILRDLPFAGAGVVLWIGDLLTLPLTLAPISSESPRRIWITAFRESAPAEASQYILGLVGVLLTQEQPWAVFLLLVPTGLVYLTFKKEMDADTFELLKTMADSVDQRNPYAAGHSERVTNLVAGILRELHIYGQEARHILIAARLHELGRMGLPDSILIKSGDLTPEERRLIESSPDRAVQLLSGYPDFARCAEMVRHQHERWDGSGYPDHLTATDIPFGARVIAVADSFDAMTSDRPYRPALTPSQAAVILRDGRGRQWEPSIVDALLQSLGNAIQPETAAPVRGAADVPAATAQQVPA